MQAKSDEPLGTTDPLHEITPLGRSIWLDRFEQMDRRDGKVSVDRTIQAQVKAFLDHKEAQVIGNERSVGRWGAVRTHLDYLSTWIGPKSPIDSLTAAKLEGYYTHLLKNQGISASYKRDLFATAKMLIQYVEHDLIPLPRNIRSSNLKFRKVSKKVKVFRAF